MIVEQGGEQVVGAGDGVEVAGEVQVDVVHGGDLGVAAAGGAALHAEAGAEGGLPQADHGAGAEVVEGVAEADGGGGFTLAGGRRADAGDEHQLARRASRGFGHEVERDLGLEAAVGLQCVAWDAGRVGDFGDGAEGGGPGDVEVGFQGGAHAAWRWVMPMSDRVSAMAATKRRMSSGVMAPMVPTRKLGCLVL